MLRPADDRLHERILLFGPAGTGKSTAVASIANMAQKTNSDARFHIIDTDLAWDRMLAEGYPHLANVDVHVALEWPEYREALAKIKETVRPCDWVVVDLIGNAWETVQSYFTEQVFDRDIGDYFLQIRKEMKAGSKKLEAFSGWVDWCVDEDTEILTMDGWKRHANLVYGDHTLAFDIGTGTSRWEPVEGVYRSAGWHRMTRMVGASHDSLTTPGHRWPVSRRPSSYHGPVPASNLLMKTTGTLACHDGLLLTGPRGDCPDVAKYSDAFVELVGWYWTEGWPSVRRRADGTLVAKGGGIAQSERRNPEKLARIEAALRAEYGEPGPMAGSHRGDGLWNRVGRDDGVVTFRLSKKVVDELEAVAPDKVLAPDFLLSLTLEQARLLVDVSILADGTTSRSGQRTLAQNDQRRVRAFEMACAVAGMASCTHPVRDDSGRFGRAGWSVSLLRKEIIYPVGAAAQKTSRFTISDLWWEGTIWCPVVPSGTWLARRNGTVYFTGNSVINAMYKSWAHDLLFKTRAHILCATKMGKVDLDRDDKATRVLFGPHGVKPEGQKALAYQFHTVLLTGQPRTGEWTLTTVKDRERVQLDKEPVSNFALSYLKKVGGWKL